MPFSEHQIQFARGKGEVFFALGFEACAGRVVSRWESDIKG